MTQPESDAPSRSRVVQRRTLLMALGAGGLAAGLTACTTSSASPSPTTSAAAATTTAPAAPAAADGQITAAGVARGLKELPAIIERQLATTKVPGLGAAVVYDGQVRYLAGHGVRELGQPAKIDPDTVFYLASVSKPLSSTVVGAAFTKKVSKASWDTTLASQLKGFTLEDPWVGSHVTVADMFSHRSGLPDHAGNLIEDLGYDRDYIVSKLKNYPLHAFRDHYDYTNYGLTAGAEALAATTKLSWNALAQEMIFKPLGMTSSSYAYADLLSRKNRTKLHPLVDGKYTPAPDWDYEPQSPAGGASSSVRDMAAWVTMMLAQGQYKGAEVVNPEQLVEVWSPAFMNKPPTKIGAWGSFYGYGWNVSYQMTGQLQVGHSGAFARGAATSVVLIPEAKLGTVFLANGAPVGLPESISAEFMDFVRYGKSTQDWLKVIGPFFEEKPTADQLKYAKPATSPKPARSLSAYVGSYRNSTYGPITVSIRGGALSFTVGPQHQQFALKHYSGDDFYFQTTGEDQSGFSGAIFAGTSGGVTALTINAWDRDGLGVFTR